MSEKSDSDQKNKEDDTPGFRINLPFGMGWLRGDGSHLTSLMPVIRLMLLGISVLYLALRIIEEAGKL